MTTPEKNTYLLHTFILCGNVWGIIPTRALPISIHSPTCYLEGGQRNRHNHDNRTMKHNRKSEDHMSLSTEALVHDEEKKSSEARVTQD